VQVVAAVIALPEFATLHGASSPAPNAATYCTGYENPIEFNPNTGMASNQKQYATVAAGPRRSSRLRPLTPAETMTSGEAVC